MQRGMHVERSQQGTTGLPGAVARDLGDARQSDAAVEAPVKVARLNRRAVAGREDQASFHPGAVRPVPVSRLPFASELQRGYAQAGQGKRRLG